LPGDELKTVCRALGLVRSYVHELHHRDLLRRLERVLDQLRSNR